MKIVQLSPEQTFMYSGHVCKIDQNGRSGGGNMPVSNLDTGASMMLPANTEVELVDLEEISETVEHHKEVLEEMNEEEVFDFEEPVIEEEKEDADSESKRRWFGSN